MPKYFMLVFAITFFLSIAVMVASAGNMSVPSFATAGLAFAATAAIAAWRLRPASPATAADGRNEARISIERSTALVALIYAWGGLSLFAVYPHSGLVWRHSWQYGLGMLVAAAGLALYIWAARRPDGAITSPHALDGAAAAAALHCAGIAVAIGYILSSGKLLSVKDDWAAHWIFVTGGLALLVAGLLEVTSHLRLRGKPRDQR